MSSRRPSTRAIVQLLPLDFIFNLLIPALFALTMQVPRMWEAAFVAFGLALIRNAIWVLVLRAAMRPVDDWARTAPDDRSDGLVRRAVEGIRRTPGRFLSVYVIAWCAALLGTVAWVVLTRRAGEPLGWRFLVASASATATILIGAGVFAYTTSGSILRALHLPVLADAQRRGISAAPSAPSIRIRIAFLAIAVALTPVGWLGGIALRFAETSAIERTEAEARAAAYDGALRLARGGDVAGLEGTSVRAEGGDGRWGWLDDRDGRRGVRVEPLAERVLAFERLGDGRVLVAAVPIEHDAFTAMQIAIGFFWLAVVVWAPISAFAFGRDIGDNVGLVSEAVQRVVQVGDLRAMEALPVSADDEIGELTRHFNTLLASLRTLADESERVAEGDLNGSIAGRGDLPDAFRGMLDGLRDVVRRIRDTSVEVASAAAEIYSASQEQEAAAAQQSASINEMAQTMESLTESAGHISESASDVLSDAERTRATTEQMATRIAELNAHSGRIGELLEVIREVADRSDLLALNGSLEATRAGEAGRGFALVAGEMRRLAERVTATVSDVRGLLADIRASGSATVMATEESRKLAEGTSENSRRISQVTQQQRSATGQVTQSVRETADVLRQAATATTQTRVSAEQLKAQADELEALLERFRVGDEAAA
ncbi:MAG TPA: methyl-accepting chemotaxis protein [Sandaracinaceae bacterium LLY-WYZ-13_1]|nr:methyl-accepting chemotaxis protein [Sandaracinaceae bacterium LLY-WYZ-13_1]